MPSTPRSLALTAAIYAQRRLAWARVAAHGERRSAHRVAGGIERRGPGQRRGRFEPRRCPRSDMAFRRPCSPGSPAPTGYAERCSATRSTTMSTTFGQRRLHGRAEALPHLQVGHADADGHGLGPMPPVSSAASATSSPPPTWWDEAPGSPRASASERGRVGGRWGGARSSPAGPRSIGVDEDHQRGLGDVERHLRQQLIALAHLDIVAGQTRVRTPAGARPRPRRRRHGAAYCRSR